MHNKSKYWLTLSCLLGAAVLSIGFAPVPLLFVMGALLVFGFLSTGLIYGQWQKSAIRSGTLAAPVPVFGAIVAFNLALMLRNSDFVGILIPALAVALSFGCYVWSRNHGPYVNPNVTGQSA